MTKSLTAFALAVFLAGPLAAQIPRPADVPLRVELQADPLAVKFINTGKEPVRILKPVDGSEWGWVMPHYKLTAIDGRDREVGLAARCKLYGAPYMGTKWPDDYVVTIRPSESRTHPISLLSLSIRTEGMYRLRFEYRFTPKADGLPGLADAPYPPDLWRGSVTSNEVEVRLRPNQ
jgi:hypothetical protein